MGRGILPAIEVLSENAFVGVSNLSFILDLLEFSIDFIATAKAYFSCIVAAEVLWIMMLNSS